MSDMEVEDREEQDLVWLTQVPCLSIDEEQPPIAATSPSPSKSSASTKDISVDEEDYDFDLAYGSSREDDDYEIISKLKPGQPLMGVQPGIISKIEAAEANQDNDDADRRSKKRKLIGVTVLILLIGIAVGVGVAVSGGKNDKDKGISLATTKADPEEDDTTPAPSGAPIDLFLPVAARLFSSPAQYPTDESSPSYKAVMFLSEEDTSDRDISKLGQRYALVNMFYSLGGPEWTESFGFLSHEMHECDWNDIAADGLIKGVICESVDKFVNYLSIPNNNLVGTIPQHVGYLAAIYHFDLSFNTIGGIIPQGLVAASGMERLSLNSNQLIGTVPSYIYNSYDNLEFLSIENNLLTGDIDKLCVVPGATLRADCLGSNPEIACSCCQLCCDAQEQCM